mgnify:CR=1 FL=1
MIPIHVKSGIRADEIKSDVIQEAFKKGQFPKNDFSQNEDNNRIINSENLRFQKHILNCKEKARFKRVTIGAAYLEIQYCEGIGIYVHQWCLSHTLLLLCH